MATVLLLGALSGCTQLKPLLAEFDSGKPKWQNRAAKAKLDSALITEAFSTGSCESLSRGGSIWFTDAATLADWLKPLGARQSKLILDRAPLETKGALLVDLGTVPTPGYSIGLVTNRLAVTGNKAVVHVDLMKSEIPGPGAANKRRPQVLTHPCSLFVLPRFGYSTLEVLTGPGEFLISFDNN